MESKHATMMSDEEVLEKYKELSVRVEMSKLVTTGMRVSEMDMFNDLVEEIKHRELDVDYTTSETEAKA